jgi:DNA polymerase-3 subunit delta'
MDATDRWKAEALAGHAAHASRFDTLFRRGRIAGAYLFIGPDQSRPDTFAAWLAKAVLCLEPTAPFGPCDRCRSCVQFDAGSHPDLDLVRKPEDRGTIPLDAFIGDAEHRMRAGLCWRIRFAPALSRRKVAVILDADALSDEASNALLKTLEEPPDASAIILVGRTIERQLPTIRSRCQAVRFRPLDPAELPPKPVDAESEAFRRDLAGSLADRTLAGPRLARDVTAWVEAAGKEPAARRERLKQVMEVAIDAYRGQLRRSIEAVQASVQASVQDETLVRLAATLEAIELVDANMNVAMLIDAWTALLEDPRPPQLAKASLFD